MRQSGCRGADNGEPRMDLTLAISAFTVCFTPDKGCLVAVLAGQERAFANRETRASD